MKVILAVVVAIVIAMIAINYFTTGEFSVMPPSSSGSDDGQVTVLREEFKKAARDYRQAERQAGIAGLDMTEAGAAALADLKHIEESVSDLTANAAEKEVRDKARTLLEEIKQYRRDIK